MSLDLTQILARAIAARQLAEAGREAVIADRLKSAGPRVAALLSEWRIPFDELDALVQSCLGFSSRHELPSVPPMLPERPEPLRQLLLEHALLLYRGAGDRWVLGMADPLLSALRDQVSLLVGRTVPVVLLTQQELESGRASFGEAALARSAGPAAEGTGEREYDIESDQSPVVQLVDLTIQEAIRRKASDIHVEPFEKAGIVRYRIDGVLVKAREYPIELHAAVSSRIKLMSGMDIAERRVPQDGRIQYKGPGPDLDLRVSTTPTNFGESAVLRLLSRASIRVDLGRGGFRPQVLAAFRRSMNAANGIILVTGPTGSGKTTTLYGMVNELNDIQTKIFTIEDPVEYVLEGIVQIPVRSKVGLTFAAALRAAMRQDPDIIMIGEIRDQETASIAIQASLTGHLVLATLHTNSAPATLTRLVDMGIEPYNLSATMEAVLAQRLVRRLCSACRAEVAPAASVVTLFEQQRIPPPPALFEARGCEACGSSGYAGRMGVHEFMPVTETLRVAINRNAPETELARLAVSEGMQTLLQDGLVKVASGDTTAKELLRVVGGSL